MRVGYAGAWGYQEDRDSGYYDPSTGRFLTRDSVKEGRNWYSYCENGPTVGVDENGLEDWSKSVFGGGHFINRSPGPVRIVFDKKDKAGHRQVYYVDVPPGCCTTPNIDVDYVRGYRHGRPHWVHIKNMTTAGAGEDGKMYYPPIVGDDTYSAWPNKMGGGVPKPYPNPIHGKAPAVMTISHF